MASGRICAYIRRTAGYPSRPKCPARRRLCLRTCWCICTVIPGRRLVCGWTIGPGPLPALLRSVPAYAQWSRLSDAGACCGAQRREDRWKIRLPRKIGYPIESCRAAVRFAASTAGHRPATRPSAICGYKRQIPRSAPAYRGGFALDGKLCGLQYPQSSTKPKSSTKTCRRAAGYVTRGAGVTPGVCETRKEQRTQPASAPGAGPEPCGNARRARFGRVATQGEHGSPIRRSPSIYQTRT